MAADLSTQAKTKTMVQELLVWKKVLNLTNGWKKPPRNIITAMSTARMLEAAR